MSHRTPCLVQAPSTRRAHGRRALPHAVAAAAALLLSTPAAAQQFTLQAETDAAFWIDTPQANRFTPGFQLAIRPGISLGRYVSVQLSYGLLVTPAGPDFSELGMAHEAFMGVRFRPLAGLRPPEKQLDGLFIDANLGYVRTGELDRFGFDVGLGYNFQVAPTFALGPVFRYNQIVQPDNIQGIDPRDAQWVSVGLNFAFGPAHKAKAADPVQAPPECPDVGAAPECPQPVAVVQACDDADQDGVCDSDDRCPDEVGPAATLGCPVDPCTGKPLVVLVQFEQDSSAMPARKVRSPQTMDPVLDAVAMAITQDPSCRVCIIGHASEEGSSPYNLNLSRERAAAVKAYMASKGLVESRMPTTGMGETCQLVPEDTRPLNRRVEFHRLSEGEACPTACLE